MKRAFSTLACMDASLSEAVRLARKHHIGDIEIRTDKRENVCGVTLDEADAIRAALDGISALSLNTGITLRTENDVRYAADLACKAYDCGVSAVRVFVTRLPETPRLLNALCAQTDAQILVETHGAYSSARELKKLLASCPRAQAIWDVLHTLEAGETVEESTEALCGRIAHVHVKDARLENGLWRQTALGAGEIRPDQILAALRAVGFDGAVSLEWEGYWEPALKGLYASCDELLCAFRQWFPLT